MFIARMNYSYLQLFNVLKGGIVKIDARFKISAEQQELTHYQYKILSGLKEQWEGNYGAEITLISKEDGLIELCFSIGNDSLIKHGLQSDLDRSVYSKAGLRKLGVH